MTEEKKAIREMKKMVSVKNENLERKKDDENELGNE